MTNITKIYETNSHSSNPLPVLMTALKKKKHEVDYQDAFRFHVHNPSTDWEKQGTPGHETDDMMEVTWSPSDDELTIEHFHGDHGVDRETIIVDGGRLNPSNTAEIVNSIERMFRRGELK